MHQTISVYFKNMKKYIIFYKPFNVLTQFTGEAGVRNLSEFNLPKEVYAAGRLDKDSEGLLLLTNDGKLIKELLDPLEKNWKTYWVQVECTPSLEDLQRLEKGVLVKNHMTLPCKAKLLDNVPELPPRAPPIRERKNIATSWLEIKICEGKNRQVRRMTAAIGFPTLRLIRVAIGDISLAGLSPGQWKEVNRPYFKN